VFLVSQLALVSICMEVCLCIRHRRLLVTLLRLLLLLLILLVL
jgi:hypothetical protein